MPDWITDIDDATAKLERWNRRRGHMVSTKTLTDPANEVPVAVYMLFGDVLSAGQVTALEQLLTDDQMDDTTSLNYLTQLRAAVKACVVDGGIKAPTELLALPGKTWTVIAELRLRCDEAPTT